MDLYTGRLRLPTRETRIEFGIYAISHSSGQYVVSLTRFPYRYIAASDGGSPDVAIFTTDWDTPIPLQYWAHLIDCDEKTPNPNIQSLLPSLADLMTGKAHPQSLRSGIDSMWAALGRIFKHNQT